jgi:hypothetical protein
MQDIEPGRRPESLKSLGINRVPTDAPGRYIGHE